MDIIIDYYFEVLETINNKIEEVEDILWSESNDDTLSDIHHTRRQLIQFRKNAWPLRDNMNAMLRDESPFIKDETKLFLRDVYDHTVQIIDNLDNNRELVSGLHDMYMTNISNKMNEVMKVLTIIATIFIPLTFLAGIYGMNFENMPELALEMELSPNLGSYDTCYNRDDILLQKEKMVVIKREGLYQKAFS